MTNKKIKLNTTEPSKEELDIICKELSNPKNINKGLVGNATPLEKSKHHLCRQILNYKLNNHLTTEEIAERINLTVPETKDVLLCHIEEFTLDRLVSYASKLLAPFHLDLHAEQPKKSARVSVKAKNNILIPRKSNNRLRKHL